MNTADHTPILSLIIPCGDTKHLAETLRRTHFPSEHTYEIVLVNESRLSNEEFSAQFSREDSLVVEGPRTGIANAMNAGIDAASGMFFMRCDSDDFIPANSIDRRIDYLLANKEIRAVLGARSFLEPDGSPLPFYPDYSEPFELTEELRAGEIQTHPCTLCAYLEDVRSCGKFREFFFRASDYDFVLRLSEIARVMYLPENLYSYRVHGSSITAKGMGHNYVDLAKSFQRERLAGQKDALQRGEIPEKEPVDAIHYLDKLYTRIRIISRQAYRAGDRAVSLRLALKLRKYRPYRIGSWLFVIIFFLRPLRFWKAADQR